MDGTFSRSDFVFDPESNLYVCPGGTELRKYHRAFAKPRDGLTKDGTMIYFARKHDCETCALKPKCCPNVPARKIARSIHEAARDKARAIAKTEPYAVSRRERKKVEMLFAHLKRILRPGRLRLVAQMEPRTSSFWRPPPKTFESWRSSSPFRRRSSPHEPPRPSFASLKAFDGAIRCSERDRFSTSGNGRELLREGRYDRPGRGRGDPTWTILLASIFQWTRPFPRPRPRRGGGLREQDGVHCVSDRQRIGQSAELSSDRVRDRTNGADPFSRVEPTRSASGLRGEPARLPGAQVTRDRQDRSQ